MRAGHSAHQDAILKRGYVGVDALEERDGGRMLFGGSLSPGHPIAALRIRKGLEEGGNLGSADGGWDSNRPGKR